MFYDDLQRKNDSGFFCVQEERYSPLELCPAFTFQLQFVRFIAHTVSISFEMFVPV